MISSAGAHPLATKQRLGHSTIQVTMDRYGRMLPSLDASLTAALDDEVSRARSK